VIAGPETPSPNGHGKGRGRNGRFANGWKGGPGNPLAAKTERLRAALVNAVSEEDIAKMAKGLVKAANRGSPAAASVVWDRIFGKAKQPMEFTGKDGGKIRIEVVYVDRAAEHVSD
jgi:hypothetical protein